MKHRSWASVLVLAAVLMSGCTSLREIPRSQYAAQPERKNVRIVTNDGLTYEFDFVRLNGDTLVGYRQRDVEGAFEEFGSLPVPLGNIRTLATRGVDWYRTGLIGGGFIAAVVVAGLSGNNNEPTAETSGGTGGREGP